MQLDLQWYERKTHHSLIMMLNDRWRTNSDTAKTLGYARLTVSWAVKRFEEEELLAAHELLPVTAIILEISNKIRRTIGRNPVWKMAGKLSVSKNSVSWRISRMWLVFGSVQSICSPERWRGADFKNWRKCLTWPLMRHFPQFALRLTRLNRGIDSLGLEKHHRLRWCAFLLTSRRQRSPTSLHFWFHLGKISTDVESVVQRSSKWRVVNSEVFWREKLIFVFGLVEPSAWNQF